MLLGRRGGDSALLSALNQNRALHSAAHALTTGTDAYEDDTAKNDEASDLRPANGLLALRI